MIYCIVIYNIVLKAPTKHVFAVFTLQFVLESIVPECPPDCDL